MGDKTDWTSVGIGAGIFYLVYKFVSSAEMAGNAIGQGLSNLFGEKKYTLDDANRIFNVNLDLGNRPEEFASSVNKRLRDIGLPTGNTPAQTWSMQKVPDISSTQFKSAVSSTLNTLDKQGFVNAQGKIDFTRKSVKSTGTNSSSSNVAKPISAVETFVNVQKKQGVDNATIINNALKNKIAGKL